MNETTGSMQRSSTDVSQCSV